MSALSLSLRDKDRLRDRESLTISALGRRYLLRELWPRGDIYVAKSQETEGEELGKFLKKGRNFPNFSGMYNLVTDMTS